MLRGMLAGAIVVSTLTSVVSCEEEDPGPFVVDGWIDRCHDSCDQQLECTYDQLVFDHGDIDNCKRTCGVQLERGANLAFIDETPESCLEALYADLKCIFGLSCASLSAWKDKAEGYPCQAEGQAVEHACAGVDYEEFREICEYPLVIDWTW